MGMLQSLEDVVNTLNLIVLKSIAARTYLAVELLETGRTQDAVDLLKTVNKVLPKPTETHIAIARAGIAKK